MQAQAREACDKSPYHGGSVLRILQVISDEKQKEEGFAVARIVADAGIEAAQRPIKLLVPAVAAILSWRTLTLGLQIFVENEMFREHHRLSSRKLLLILHLSPNAWRESTNLSSKF